MYQLSTLKLIYYNDFSLLVLGLGFKAEFCGHFLRLGLALGRGRHWPWPCQRGLGLGFRGLAMTANCALPTYGTAVCKACCFLLPLLSIYCATFVILIQDFTAKQSIQG